MKRYYVTPDGRVHSVDHGRSAFSGLPGLPGILDDDRAFTIGQWPDDIDDEDDDEFDEMLFGAFPDLYGAAKKARKRGRAGKGKLRQLQAMALARQAGGFSMPGKGAGYGMDLALPFKFSMTAAQQGLNIELKPQDKFRLVELIIASPNAQLVEFSRVDVGTQNQFIGNEGPLSGDIVSSQTLRNISLKGSIASPGVLVNLTANNLDANAQTFWGVVKGPVVRYGDAVAG